uniref:Uncharacterized protein n=1 Tax=Sphaerodactylus townsendi TaxID=933632 RepID=A0ACB8ESU0_9SAUR
MFTQESLNISFDDKKSKGKTTCKYSISQVLVGSNLKEFSLQRGALMPVPLDYTALPSSIRMKQVCKNHRLLQVVPRAIPRGTVTVRAGSTTLKSTSSLQEEYMYLTHFPLTSLLDTTQNPTSGN